MLKSGGGGVRIEEYLAEGRKIFSFIADFRAVQPLWKRIVKGFLQANLENAILLFGLDEYATQKDFEDAGAFITSVGIGNGKIVFFVPPKFPPYLLRNSTQFITTREFINVECLDWLYDTNVKIVSALDDAIFESEPAVNWDEVYK